MSGCAGGLILTQKITIIIGRENYYRSRYFASTSVLLSAVTASSVLDAFLILFAYETSVHNGIAL